MASHELRAPPKAAKLLLCVWGYSYVRQFLECGLPTLLAPGNVPALAAALPTEFIILTSADDESFIVEHPAFKQLDSVCKTTIHPIDHLITDGNYSTTITLAFTEAVREVGEDMVDTCFFFLVSDYIVADGSFANALKRMQQGTSAVVVGNMQVARESALPWLQERLAGNELGLALQPRELMQWALNNLHPLVLANIVNLPFSHNTDSNRLFWRVDGNTMIGRFYLMHMLCVRPEITDFIIGSSCDYSFIPEMCPSGNVDAITDSDEYLVIEMQARMHESEIPASRPDPGRAAGQELERMDHRHSSQERQSLAVLSRRRAAARGQSQRRRGGRLHRRHCEKSQPQAAAVSAAIPIGTAPWRRFTRSAAASSTTRNGFTRSACRRRRTS